MLAQYLAPLMFMTVEGKIEINKEYNIIGCSEKEYISIIYTYVLS